MTSKMEGEVFHHLASEKSAKYLLGIQNLSQSESTSIIYDRSENHTVADVDEHEYFAFFTVTMCVLACIGVVENLLSLLCLLHIRKPWQPFHYLLINLALSDLILSVLIALSTGVYYTVQLKLARGPEVLCAAFVLADASYVFLITPLLVTSGFVINQYLSVTKALEYDRIVTERRVNLFNIFCYGLTAFFYVVMHLSYYIAKLPADCFSHYSEMPYYHVGQCYLVGVIFIATTSIDIILYLQLYTKIRRISHGDNAAQHKVNKTIALLLGTIILFWVPGIANAFVNAQMSPQGEGEPQVKIIVGGVTNLIMILNPLCDPFIYGLRMPDFREGCRRLIARCWEKCGCCERCPERSEICKAKTKLHKYTDSNQITDTMCITVNQIND
ncbi:adrenocorticotropic hormone receptor [Lingula anatina]|uniref:Adrenocorticotropic hormone receptor n=1 Tax=Lingula anatina TaxID=7574 RepID=A0A1S3IRV9_LINAN|nr:adrenocorticotropic hormone receptor [Lingula anatina]XP_013400940.1 adrenocorticotropic hormone receptor [Lingula anatina]XP_013400941.1 adrenocorticotropic hormone receptor [Lingula anatina]XP_013400942.1 adrenocorticotropic hormone receptor [Lingula anatina]XP_013400943.1 adrenocorticotropic hormone receptor [Lingula anatina]XP_013400944.1 adrenocorticotropic hormone receptor [Lingula anatina]XP_013400945.1 adrenocorticotropic hormone receptor [Lingula anatina]XP_013400948.1 adrenocort|eukprot:XP_013400939.1 adrenocorticotropic hormone receptor [Lingula anatina]